MSTSWPKPFVSEALGRLIGLVYALSPYRWLDRLIETREAAAATGAQREALRSSRYFVSEAYIVGWLVLAVGLLAVSQHLANCLLWLPVLRIVGILNKEAGVVLFGTCKITEARKITSPDRVVPLALCNYLCAALLFALLHTRFGAYSAPACSAKVDSCGLDVPHAVAQSFAIAFTLSPAYSAQDLAGVWMLDLQAAFSFLFVTLIVTTFVSSLSEALKA